MKLSEYISLLELQRKEFESDFEDLINSGVAKWEIQRIKAHSDYFDVLTSLIYFEKLKTNKTIEL